MPGAPKKRSGIEAHPGFLNFVFFKASPSSISAIAEEADKRIRGTRQARADNLNVVWLPGFCPPSKSERDLGPPYYLPRVYDLTGTFDVGAVFFSRELELSTWMQVDEMRTAGQGINICLLPTAESLGFPARNDFNRQFRERYAKSARNGKRHLPEDQTFVAVVKVKLNPAVLWSLDDKDRMRTVLAESWKRIERWRREVRKEGNRPLVAMGLGLGWNEVLIIAHAASPKALLRLPTLLRQAHLELGEGREQQGVSHSAVTTITTLGADFHLRIQAEERLREHSVSRSARGTAISAEELVEAAIPNPHWDPGWPPPPLEGNHFLQIGLHTYPGHGLHLRKKLEELRAALVKKKLLHPDEPGGSVEVGKRDIWSPRIPFSRRLPAREAFILRSLIQLWVREGVDNGETASLTGAQRPIPTAFDFYTRLASPLESTRVDEKEQAEVLRRHVTGLIPKLFKIPELHNFFRKSNAAEKVDHRRLLHTVRRQLRVLQVPYPLSEQLLTLLGTFFWVYDREEVWDESVELIPVVLAFLSFLEGVERWWIEEGGRVPLLPTDVYSFSDKETAFNERARRLLSGFLGNDLLKFVRSFRSYFYSRHMSGYFTDEMPDFNFRYRGSVQQLLTVSNMILDSLLEIVIGPRACMAVIGGEGSPEMSFPCDITAVRLGTPAFRFPILLEALGHEVGHQFVLEILRDGLDEHWRKHPWVRPRADSKSAREFTTLVVAAQRINQVTFLGRALEGYSEPPKDYAPAHYFVESTADLIEKTIFGYRSVAQWIPGFMLRILLGGRPIWMDGDGGWNPKDGSQEHVHDVPRLDETMTESAVIRVVLVAAAEALCQGTAVPRKLSDFRRRMFDHDWLQVRRVLFEKCVLGDTRNFGGVLASDERWKAWILEHVIPSTPWLREQLRFEPAVAFYRALDSYLKRSLRHPDPGPGQLWNRISGEFAALREPIHRSLENSLYVRQWLNEEQHEEARSRALIARLETDPEHRFYPWAATPQPIQRSEDRLRALLEGKTLPELPAFELIVFQRGAVLPIRVDAQRAWYEGSQTFLLQMLSLSGAWRELLLEKAERSLQETTGAGR